ncbi:MAG: carboxypeptidase-like regulatory domain-containing protein [Acidobacteriota bacterium]
MAAFLLSMALLLAGQINPAKPPNPATPKEKCTISGTVLSAATGQPLRDAAVMLYKVGASGTPLAVATDAGGHFEIKNVDPGRYSLAASHPGYVRTEYGQQGGNGPGRHLTLLPGQAAKGISFQLLREAVITGHVYNEDGEPIEGAQVRALQERYFQGKRRLMPSRFASTDDRGKYRLYGLAPGTYYVTASTSLMHYGNPFNYAPSYYPGATDAHWQLPHPRPGDRQYRQDSSDRRLCADHDADGTLCELRKGWERQGRPGRL